MAQQQLDVFEAHKFYMVEVNPNLSVKVWKKGKEGMHVTFLKAGVKIGFSIHMDTFTDFMASKDMICLASDFLQGLVGSSPEDDPVPQDEITCNTSFMVHVNQHLCAKVWKKGKNSMCLTLQKIGVKGSLTIPMDTFVDLMTAHDTICLASDFIRGLVGFSLQDEFEYQNVDCYVN